MGHPTQVIRKENNTYFIYARGPMGYHTYRLEFDSAGSLRFYEQLLTEQRFKEIKPDMPASEVESIIGPSLEKRSLARDRGNVWSYRFENPWCIWFEVEFTRESKVRSSGYSRPPECLRSKDD